MAAAGVENLCLVTTGPSEREPMNPAARPADQLLTVQNCYLAYHVTMHNLDGRNGLRPRSISHDAINERRFKLAMETLKKGCKTMKDRHHQEMVEYVKNLDISDSQLYTTYIRAISTLMSEEIRWGRIVSLFFFTGVLAERLHKEGHIKKVESLIDWLAAFLNDNLSQWISEQRGQWAGIIDGITFDPPVSNIQTHKPVVAEPKAGASNWMTLAAVGVGAFVVGALAIR